MGVEINSRGNAFHIIGTKKSVNITEHILQSLYEMTATETLSPETVHLHLQDTSIAQAVDEDEDSESNIKTEHGVIRGRSPNQRNHLEKITTHDFSFGIGPEGPG